MILAFPDAMWWILLPVAMAADENFEQILREGLEQSPEADRLAAERDLSKARATARGALANPEAEWESAGGEQEFRASWAVPWTGRPVAVWKGVSAEKATAEFEYRRGTADFVAELGRAYVDALRASERAGLAREVAMDAERSRTAVRALESAGEWSSLDRVVAETVGLESIATASKAEQEALASYRNVEVLLGREPTAEFRPAAWPKLSIPADPSSLSVKAAESAVRTAKHARTAAVLDLLPTPEIIAGVHLHANPDPIVGVRLELPLFSPGVARLAEARAELRLAEASLERRNASQQAEWSAAVGEEQAASEAWRRISEVQGLDDALSQTERAFEIGEISLLEYATRREHLLRARHAQIDAHHRWAVARIELWRLAGQIPVEMP